MTIDGLRYVDTCEFWKDQYTKIHGQKKVLEDRVHCLEEAQRLVRESVHSDGSIDEVIIVNPKKRPAPMQEVEERHSGDDDLALAFSEDSILRLSSYSE